MRVDDPDGLAAEIEADLRRYRFLRDAGLAREALRDTAEALERLAELLREAGSHRQGVDLGDSVVTLIAAFRARLVADAPVARA